MKYIVYLMWKSWNGTLTFVTLYVNMIRAIINYFIWVNAFIRKINNIFDLSVIGELI